MRKVLESASYNPLIGRMLKYDIMHKHIPPFSTSALNIFKIVHRVHYNAKKIIKDTFIRLSEYNTLFVKKYMSGEQHSGTNPHYYLLILGKSNLLLLVCALYMASASVDYMTFYFHFFLIVCHYLFVIYSKNHFPSYLKMRH